MLLLEFNWRNENRPGTPALWNLTSSSLCHRSETPWRSLISCNSGAKPIPPSNLKSLPVQAWQQRKIKKHQKVGRSAKNRKKFSSKIIFKPLFRSERCAVTNHTRLIFWARDRTAGSADCQPKEQPSTRKLLSRSFSSSKFCHIQNFTLTELGLFASISKFRRRKKFGLQIVQSRSRSKHRKSRGLNNTT